MKTKRSLLLSLVLLLAIIAQAGSVTGKLVDSKTKAGLDYVNVVLFNATTNKMVKGASTASGGNFNFLNIPMGKYLLKATFVGYSQLELPIIIDAKRPELTLGSIALTENSHNLKEVKIEGQKSQMRFEIDRKVFNVDQNLAAAGASASEILKNIPSVQVDVEGNVSLRNDQNVTIWINGRPSGLSADNQAQILQQMPAESIERIEVITNPSSKFSPDGSAGIINIVLKKDRKAGYYGSVSVGGDTFKGINSAFNINYTSPKWDAYANVGFRKNEFKMWSDGNRNTWKPNGDTTNLVTDNNSKMGGYGVFSRAGVTYHADDKNDIGVSGMFMTSDRYNRSNVAYESHLNEVLNNQYSRYSDGDGNHGMFNMMLDYTHKFNQKGHEIRSTVEYNGMNFGNNSTMYQMDAVHNTITNPVLTQWINSDNKRREVEVQMDYTYPISENSKLEAGYKGEFNKRSSPTDAELHTLILSRRPQYELNNEYNGRDNRNSLYITYSGKISKLSYQAGLRGEYNVMKNTAVNYDKYNNDSTTTFNKTYPGIYPSLFVNYTLGNGNELQLNYTRRINRPNGRAMNPYRNVSDSLNISYGNPNLTPEYSNSLELNHIKTWENHSLSSSIYYHNTSDVIQSVSYVEYINNKSVKFSTSQNITNSQAAGCEFILKDRFMKFIDVTSTLNMFYNQLDGFTYADTYYKGTESFAWNARMMVNMGLPGGLMGQLTGGYQSKRNIVQGESLPSWDMDAGLRKTFFNRKFIVNVMVRDLLNSRKNRVRTWGSNYNDYTVSQFGGRMFGINLTYNFGSQSLQKKKPTKQRENGDTDIMNGNDM